MLETPGPASGTGAVPTGPLTFENVTVRHPGRATDAVSASPSPWNRVRPWPSSARAVPASPRRSTSRWASYGPPTAGCASGEPISPASTWRSGARASPGCRSDPICTPERSPRTSGWPAPTPTTEPYAGRCGTRARWSSSMPSPRARTRSWARTVPCPPVSASGSPWPGPFSPTGPCCCSTSRRQRRPGHGGGDRRRGAAPRRRPHRTAGGARRRCWTWRTGSYGWTDRTPGPPARRHPRVCPCPCPRLAEPVRIRSRAPLSTTRQPRPRPNRRCSTRPRPRRPAPPPASWPASVPSPAPAAATRPRAAAREPRAGSAVGLMATSGWLISRASQQPPVLYLMVAVTATRAFGIGRAVFRRRAAGVRTTPRCACWPTPGSPSPAAGTAGPRRSAHHPPGRPPLPARRRRGRAPGLLAALAAPQAKAEAAGAGGAQRRTGGDEGVHRAQAGGGAHTAAGRGGGRLAAAGSCRGAVRLDQPETSFTTEWGGAGGDLHAVRLVRQRWRTVGQPAHRAGLRGPDRYSGAGRRRGRGREVSAGVPSAWRSCSNTGRRTTRSTPISRVHRRRSGRAGGDRPVDRPVRHHRKLHRPAPALRGLGHPRAGLGSQPRRPGGGTRVRLG
ncbi:hypothetical protein SGLAM104S_08664 [Streptomyces glaucescens]